MIQIKQVAKFQSSVCVRMHACVILWFLKIWSVQSIYLEISNISGSLVFCSVYQHFNCIILCLGTAVYQPGATSQRFHFHSDEANSLQGFLIAFEQVYHCWYRWTKPNCVHSC